SGIIDQMGFNAYFLIVWDLCRFAQEEGIWYNARGSAAGSIVAYALEISLIDPLEHGLIFERFLNPGRVSMPDIDLDFQDDKRYLLMEYCANKYGEDRVASIITFGKLKARAAVRDVGRVMDIPLSEVDRIAKMIPALPLNTTIEKALDDVPDLKNEYQNIEWVKNLLDNAKAIEGSLRNAGTHAAGVVITDKPVVEYIPLHRPTGHMGDSPINAVTQFEMSTIDSLGLLKVDFLGLSSLTIMQRCCEMIKERHGIDLNLQNIPLDDPKIYEMLGEGNTAGVFQLEGSGMTRWVKEMKPKNLSHVIAMVALYRPGPMDFIPTYIKRMHEEEEISYTHEALKDILEETYGITVYQEQIMYTAMELGGYTASEADFLRKAVAKKKEKELLKNREKFISGAKKNNIPEPVATKIFEDWEAFARYGFPKGHAADYAVIAVETAYLKYHYPVEYMTALVSVYQNDTGKVAYYVQNCLNQGIDVLPPDINRSFWDFSIEDGDEGQSCIRFGMGAVKNVGHGPVDIILEARENKPFEDLTDLANRVDLRKVGKRALESLIKVGALDFFGPRMALLDVLDKIISISAAKFQAEEIGQMSFFDNDSGLVQKIILPTVDPNYNRREQLNWERELVGLYVSDHPLKDIARALEGVITHFSTDLEQIEQKTFVRVFGEVISISKTITKKGDDMAFVQLEDTKGISKLVLFPSTWKRVAGLLKYGKVVLAEGKIDTSRGEPNILVDEIKLEIHIDSENLKGIKSSLRQVKSSNKKSSSNSQIKNEDKPSGSDPRKMKEQADENLIIEEKHQIRDKPASIQEQKELRQSQSTQPSENNLPTDYIPPVPDIPTSYNIWDGYEGENKNSSPAKEILEPELLKSAEEKNHEVEELETDDSPKNPGAEEEKSNEDVKSSLSSPTILQTSNPAIDIDPTTASPIMPPPSEADLEDEGIKINRRMLTVVMRSLGDKERDILRMRRVYGMLISDPGPDRFAFYVIERNRGYRLEFPSDTTSLTDHLLKKLEVLMGKENIILEPITIQ
ncbi:MAG: DNA polymerase III subunit alpha, partial [Aliifodinibius sp.]|nr:DNA polymerase III subunit alpha [Fodinibius sp.]